MMKAVANFIISLLLLVGNTSTSDQNAPLVGANFALQLGNPGIGHGLSKTYLSAQFVDAGACSHTLTTCPGGDFWFSLLCTSTTCRRLAVIPTPEHSLHRGQHQIITLSAAM